MNAFDFIITVALGSTLATIIISKQVALAEGALALSLLVFLQYAATWTSVRWPAFDNAIKSEPTLLYYRGEFHDRRLRRERITRDEILAAVRSAGAASMDDVEAVVLETAGELSIVRASARPGRAEAIAPLHAGPPRRKQLGAQR